MCYFYAIVSPYYASCLSVLSSVCLILAPDSKTKRRMQTKIWSFIRAAVNDASIFTSYGRRSGGKPHSMSALDRHIFIVFPQNGLKCVWWPSGQTDFGLF